MPIAWPPEDRGAPWIQGSAVVQFTQQWDITNLGGVGVEFGDGGADRRVLLDPGTPVDFEVAGRSPNLRSLGNTYEHADQTRFRFDWGPSRTLPVPVDGGSWFPQSDWAASNRALTGVSRDSTGAILGSCVIDLFVSGSDQLWARTVSDGSGVFSFGNPGTGPFYIVAYKAGSPDVAGTTVNTLLPAAV